MALQNSWIGNLHFECCQNSRDASHDLLKAITWKHSLWNTQRLDFYLIQLFTKLFKFKETCYIAYSNQAILRDESLKENVLHITLVIELRRANEFLAVACSYENERKPHLKQNSMNNSRECEGNMEGNPSRLIRRWKDQAATYFSVSELRMKTTRNNKKWGFLTNSKSQLYYAKVFLKNCETYKIKISVKTLLMHFNDISRW